MFIYKKILMRSKYEGNILYFKYKGRTKHYTLVFGIRYLSAKKYIEKQKAHRKSMHSLQHNQLLIFNWFYLCSKIMSAQLDMFHCVITNKIIDSKHN